ncbi:hypothetical protein Aperf_G00000014269 [Anoplocephala perfoliata]
MKNKFVEEDNVTGTRHSRAQITHQQANAMTSGIMYAPRGSQKRTHSEESHKKSKAENVCSSCRMIATAISSAAPDAPNSHEASVRTLRKPDTGPFDNSVSINPSRDSTLRRSSSTRGSDRGSTGSLESLRRQSPVVTCTVCHNEIISSDSTSSIRTSTSSLLGITEAVDLRAKEIADAYAAVCRGTEPLDDSTEPKEQTNLYHALRNNRIIQTVIADYERNKQSVEGRFSAEAKEISNVVAHAEKEYGNVANDRTIYSQLSHNSLVQRVVESYEAYKQSTKIDAATQTSSTPMQGQVLASGDIQEIIDVVNAFEHSEGSVEAGRTMYTELKGNPIIQRLIKEFEVDRTARASIRRPSSTPPHTEIPSTRDSKEGILSLDGQVAKMESEQFATPDIMVRGSVSIIRRQQRPHSREKPVSSSISSGSEDEDRRDWRPIQSTPSIVRFDVATSAYITPVTWDKKMQFDSLDQRQ